jgi:hypothetical protein
VSPWVISCLQHSICCLVISFCSQWLLSCAVKLQVVQEENPASDHKLRVLSGRAIAQAAWVRAQVRSCGICGGQSGTGARFLPVLRFPLPILIPPTAPLLSSIIRGWYNRPVSGRRTNWTQSHPRNLKKKKGSVTVLSLSAVETHLTRCRGKIMR